LLLVVEYLP